MADTNIKILPRKSIIKFRFSTKLIYSKLQNDYITPKGYFSQSLLITLFKLFYYAFFFLQILARHLLINFCSCIISYWAGHYVNTVKEFIGWVSKIKKQQMILSAIKYQASASLLLFFVLHTCCHKSWYLVI